MALVFPVFIVTRFFSFPTRFALSFMLFGFQSWESFTRRTQGCCPGSPQCYQNSYQGVAPNGGACQSWKYKQQIWSAGLCFAVKCLQGNVAFHYVWILIRFWAFPPRRGGGVLQKVLYGEAPPQVLLPYPFIYHFWQKLYPFRIPLTEKGIPFLYLRDMAWTQNRMFSCQF